MISKKNFDALGRTKSRLQFPKPLDAAPSLNPQSLDRYTPSKNPIIGMPDPSKYPDWKPGRTRGGSENSKPGLVLQPIPGHEIMGGDDSPCFVNGEVMTIREAKRRFG